MGETFVVIGSDAAGLSAASKAKREDPDRDVVVFEKGQWVSYAACGMPYFVKGDVPELDDLVTLTPEQVRDERDIDLRTGHEVVEIDPGAGSVTVAADGERFEQPYDDLLVATGARAIRPPFDGMDLDGVFTIHDVDEAAAIDRFVTENAPETAAVVGGGYVGVEMAEALTERGATVHLFEMLPHVLRPFGDPVAEAVEAHLREQGAGSTSTRPSPDSLVRTPSRCRTRRRVGAGRPGGRRRGRRTERRTGRGRRRRTRADRRNRDRRVRPDERRGRLRRRRLRRGDRRRHGRPGPRAAGAHREPGGPGRRPDGRREPDAGGRDRRHGHREGVRSRRRPDGPRPRGGSAGGRIRPRLGYDHGLHAGGVLPRRRGDHGVAAGRPRDRASARRQCGREGGAKRIDTVATGLHAGLTVTELRNLDLAYAPPFSPTWDPVLTAAKVLGGKLE